MLLPWLPPMPRPSPLLFAGLLAALCGLRTPAEGARSDVPARAGETTLSWAEVDRLLLDRHALSENGREALLHLIKSRLLDVLAVETGLEVPSSAIDARVAEFERQVRGDPRFPGGLADMLAAERMSMRTFRDFLRLAVVQETLARRALGIPEDGPITGEQQEMWLEGVIAERGLEERPDPWDDGVVCRLGEITITRDEFLVHLRSRTDPDDVREGCYQLLLRKRLLARMPDLSAAALEKAVEEELSRRRNKVRADPRYQGVEYERLLAAQGIRVAAWPSDPAVQVAALARSWVERSYTADDLKRVYADEREHFDGLFGEAVETWIVFLKAVKFANDLQRRNFEEARAQLVEASAGLDTHAEFETLAAGLSEDGPSRDRKGLLGWVTREGPRVPAEARAAVFGHLDGARFDPGGPTDDRRRLVGPVRTASGCMLLWLGRRRPAPAWETMVVHVHTELRRRFIEESLQRGTVETWLDGD